MDFEPYDSSGTDDDFPPSHRSRISRGRLAGNGRSGISASYSRVHDDTDMETEIHNIETEAYFWVLKASKAQADVLTWEKEAFITQLRRELRVSGDEHCELLKRVNADDVIKRIREWRRGATVQTGISANQIVRDPVPSPAASASRKKQKVTQSGSAHQSFSGPSPMYNSQAPASKSQSSSAAKRGQANGPKGKKQKSFASSGPPVRGQTANLVSSGTFANEPADPKIDPLIGRKLKTRWPDDNNFYDAVITNFDPTQGLHFLVYDKGAASESWEWVNLAEISPNDIRWEGGDPGIPRGSYKGSGNGIKNPLTHDDTSGAGSLKRLPKSHGQNRKEYPHAQNGNANKVQNIRILHTGHLLKEVERVLNSSNPNPVEIDKAKKALKEQEEALVNALAKLADISSDGESD